MQMRRCHRIELARKEQRIENEKTRKSQGYPGRPAIKKQANRAPSKKPIEYIQNTN